MKYCIVGLLMLIAPKLSNAQQFLWQPLQESTTANINLKSTSVGLLMYDFRSGVMLSTDNGDTWKELSGLLLMVDAAETTNFLFFNSLRFSLLHKDSLFLTKATDVPIPDLSNPNLLFNYFANTLAAKDSIIFLSVQGAQFLRSVDEGRTFQRIFLPNFLSNVSGIIIDNAN